MKFNIEYFKAPPITEEMRREIVKKVKEVEEEWKLELRMYWMR